jgi:hypothetical protein
VRTEPRSSTASLVRTSVFDRVGPFDEALLHPRERRFLHRRREGRRTDVPRAGSVVTYAPMRRSRFPISRTI